MRSFGGEDGGNNNNLVLCPLNHCGYIRVNEDWGGEGLQVECYDED